MPFTHPAREPANEGTADPATQDNATASEGRKHNGRRVPQWPVAGDGHGSRSVPMAGPDTPVHPAPGWRWRAEPDACSSSFQVLLPVLCRPGPNARGASFQPGAGKVVGMTLRPHVLALAATRRFGVCEH